MKRGDKIFSDKKNPKGLGLDEPPLKKGRWISWALPIVFIVVLEGGSASILNGSTALKGLTPRFQKIRVDHPYLPYLRENAAGFLGREIPVEKQPGEIRILCVGASTTVDQPRFEDSWPGRLEENLSILYPNRKITVSVQATGSWFTSDNLIFYALRAQDYNFDLVLIYDGWNDITPSTTTGFLSDYSHSRNRPKNYYPLSQLLKLLEERIYLIEKSQTFRLFQRFVLSREINSFNDRLYRGGRSTPLNGIRGIETFRRNVESITRLANGNGAKVVYLGHVELREGYLGDIESWLQHRNHQENIRQAKEVMGVTGNSFFDLAKAFPQERELFSDRIHFTPQGSKLMADRIALYLHENELIWNWNPSEPLRRIIFAFDDLNRSKPLGEFKPEEGKPKLAGVRDGAIAYPAVFLRPRGNSQPTGIKVPLGKLAEGRYRMKFGIGYEIAPEDAAKNSGLKFKLQVIGEHGGFVNRTYDLASENYSPGKILKKTTFFPWPGGEAFLLLQVLSPTTDTSAHGFFIYPILHFVRSESAD